MLHAYLLKGSFQDSVTLMALSRDLAALPHVLRISIMMGTPANKDVLRETGFWHGDLAAATPNDLCIAVDTDVPEAAEGMTDHVQSRLAELARGRRSRTYPSVRSWRRARQLAPKANLALISIAGHYVLQPARQALEEGLNVMIFSDNVSLEQERSLKTLAKERGLLVMGPDCGTAILGKAPLAFANRIPPGPIAVIGASGTGIQEVTSQIAQRGGGISQALGLGGRDLSEAIGGISALQAVTFLKADPASRVVVFVSKPPGAAVKARVLEALKGMGKPVVALFLGERGTRRYDGNVQFARTLDEAAALAVELARLDALAAGLPMAAGRTIRGLYTGGTLAAEAGLLLAEMLDLEPATEHADGFMLDQGGHRIIDLGDDSYTRGRPHPMIDPAQRNAMIRELADDTGCGVLLLDIVLGFGSNRDPAGEAARAVMDLRAARGGGDPVTVIATLTGTEEDPQARSAQAAALDEAGIVLAGSTREAVALAMRLVTGAAPPSGSLPRLLADAPSVINIGLRAFAEDLQASGVPVVHLQWEPPAGGDTHLQDLLNSLK